MPRRGAVKVYSRASKAYAKTHAIIYQFKQLKILKYRQISPLRMLNIQPPFARNVYDLNLRSNTILAPNLL